MASAEDIQKQIEELQNKLDSLKKNARQKIEKISSEVKDSNPYSRLMALQRMGIVKEYERIRSKSVAVVGKFHEENYFHLLLINFFILLIQIRCRWSWFSHC